MAKKKVPTPSAKTAAKSGSTAAAKAQRAKDASAALKKLGYAHTLQTLADTMEKAVADGVLTSKSLTDANVNKLKTAANKSGGSDSALSGVQATSSSTTQVGTKANKNVVSSAGETPKKKAKSTPKKTTTAKKQTKKPTTKSKPATTGKKATTAKKPTTKKSTTKASPQPQAQAATFPPTEDKDVADLFRQVNAQNGSFAVNKARKLFPDPDVFAEVRSIHAKVSGAKRKLSQGQTGFEYEGVARLLGARKKGPVSTKTQSSNARQAAAKAAGGSGSSSAPPKKPTTKQKPTGQGTKGTKNTKGAKKQTKPAPPTAQQLMDTTADRDEVARQAVADFESRNPKPAPNADPKIVGDYMARRREVIAAALRDAKVAKDDELLPQKQFFAPTVEQQKAAQQAGKRIDSTTRMRPPFAEGSIFRKALPYAAAAGAGQQALYNPYFNEPIKDALGYMVGYDRPGERRSGVQKAQDGLEKIESILGKVSIDSDADLGGGINVSQMMDDIIRQTKEDTGQYVPRAQSNPTQNIRQMLPQQQQQAPNFSETY